MTALIIPADTTRPVQLSKVDSLQALQRAAPLPPGSKAIIFCNEEGKLNPRANWLWTSLRGYYCRECLVGDVVVTGVADREGELTTVPREVVERVRTRYEVVERD